MSEPDTSSPSSSSNPSPNIDHVRLSHGPETVLIHLPPRLGARPIPLALLPKSLADNAARICMDFHADHQRCLAVLLLFDTASELWSYLIPRQWVSKDASCWQPARADFPRLSPTALVIGSLQARTLAGGEEPADAVPPVDGLHLVLDLESSTIHCHARVDGKTKLVQAPQILFDDLSQMLEQARPRISFV